MRTRSWGMGAALLALGAAAQAQEFAPEAGRNRPLYPGLYWTTGYGQDERDASYDQGGGEQDSAAPNYGRTSFPEQDVATPFTWHFPLFESYDIPFVSTHTFLARATLRYVRTETEGTLSRFARDDSDDATTQADGLKNNGSGVGDTTLEYGAFLLGSGDWRTREQTPYAALLLLGVTLPTGVYEHESPNNAGSNHWAFHGRLGGHWSPWSGGFVDGGYGYRVHTINYEPQFGHLAPTRQGDDRFWDLSVAQRVFSGLYLSAWITDRRGGRNEYRDPTFAPNAPEPPPPTPPSYTSRNFPDPGTYHDSGTALRTIGFGAQYFVTQHWLLALQWSLPQSGESGEFDLPFTNRQCPVGGGGSSATCSDSPDGSVRVDGLGPARSYASDRLMFTVTHHFGQGDVFTCTGCKE